MHKYLKIVSTIIFTVIIFSACSDLSKKEKVDSEGGELSSVASENLTETPEILRLKSYKEAVKFIADINALAGFSIFKDLKDSSIKDLGGGASYNRGVYFARNGDRYEVIFTEDFASLGKLIP